MHIKVPSTAFDEIKEEMQNIIVQYKDRILKNKFFIRYEDRRKS
jgi:hypothetical protein